MAILAISSLASGQGAPAIAPSNINVEPIRSTFPEVVGKDDVNSHAEFDRVRIGPLLGFGLPNLLNFGGLVRFNRYVGAGVNVGFIPTLKISYYGHALISYHEFDIHGRVFPFGGGAFVGVGMGYETARGTFRSSTDISSYLGLLPPGVNLPNPLIYESTAAIRTLILTPQLGYLYMSELGLSIGIDVGLQLPVTASKIDFSSHLGLPAGTPESLATQIRTQLLEPSDAAVRGTLYTIGRTPLPTINIRLGWLL